MIKNDNFNGKGRLTQIDSKDRNNSNVYQGDFVDGKNHGQGVLKITSPNKIYFYEGGFKNDLKHGKGKETVIDKENSYTFEGEFVDGFRCGPGVLDDPEASYKGNFKNDEFDGEGEYHHKKEEATYVGHFTQGDLSGQATIYYKDGTTAKGNVKNYYLNGQAEKTLPNGQRYVGNFKDGEFHGKGVWYDHKAGTKRQGEFHQGKRVAWISQPMEFGMTDTDPAYGHKGNKKVKLYRGGKWKDFDALEEEE